MKTYIALLTMIWSFGSYAQAPSFNHDFGLRLSTYQPETFQLQYRYHVNEKWALSANANFGIRNTLYLDGDYVIQDSIYELYSTEYNYYTYGLDFGAIRKLSFMKHNFYYVGGSVGIGATTRANHNHRTVYEPLPEDPGMSYGLHPLIGDVLESEYSAFIRNSMNLKGRIFAGMDVPIVDRLSFNFELGLLFDMQLNAVDKFTVIQLPAYLTGGLRYHFGKTKS